MPTKNKKPIPLILLSAAILCFFCGCNTKLFYPISFVDEIKEAADKYSLDRALVAAVVSTESGFDPAAVSGDGAEGLMQILPSTAEWIAFRRGLDAEELDLFDPETSLDLGCWLLSFLADRYDGNIRYALIAYNAGFGRLDDWLKNNTGENGELTEIPYAETRNYVQRITELTEKYKEIYEKELYDK